MAKCGGNLMLVDGLPIQSKKKMPYEPKKELSTYMYHKDRGMVQITQKLSQPIPLKTCKMQDIS